MPNVKYLVIPIVPADGGFGEWDRSPNTFRANSISKAVSWMTDGLETHYIELPDEELAQEGADIINLIHNEPERVFAVPTEHPGEYIYFGLIQLKKSGT